MREFYEVIMVFRFSNDTQEPSPCSKELFKLEKIIFSGIITFRTIPLKLRLDGFLMEKFLLLPGVLYVICLTTLIIVRNYDEGKKAKGGFQ